VLPGNLASTGVLTSEDSVVWEAESEESSRNSWNLDRSWRYSTLAL